MLHFHQFSSESVEMVMLNLDFSWDIEKFYAHALLRFSDPGNVYKSNSWRNKEIIDVNG